MAANTGWNEEAGAVWMQRLMETYDHLVWLNPEPESHWEYSHSVNITREVIGADRMFPMTLQGLDSAMRRLSSK